MMRSTPAISIVLPVRNGMPLLKQAVESMLAQSFGDWELLLVDDGSTDDTPAYIASLGDPRVRRLPLSGVGTTNALNHGLKAAESPLIARMDADDVADQDRLALQRRYLAEHPECVVVGCQAEEIDGEGHVIGQRRFPLSDAAIRWQMYFGCPLLHPGTMYRREAVAACGDYDTDYPCAQDYRLWARLAAAGGTLANLPRRLMRYRMHAGSVTSQRAEEQARRCARIVEDYTRDTLPGVAPGTIGALYGFLALGQMGEGVDVDALVREYRKLRERFLHTCEERPEELDGQIAWIQERLRWVCLEQAEAGLRTPWLAWQWLRRASGFDREQGTLLRILRRGLVKRFRKAACL